MSPAAKWAGKFVIGLTGNIGTGKSVVRRMLEHMGAYGIDADTLSHRAMAKGAPGYQPTLDIFGKWVLGPDGEIDRARLGKLAFSDPRALVQLETIIHPLVKQAVDFIINRANQRVIVVEAIKLLESDLRSMCDSIWVTHAPPEVQLVRLMQQRKMNEADARQRITSQPPQDAKLAAASIIIRNDDSYENTWKQVNAAWGKTVNSGDVSPVTIVGQFRRPTGELLVLRGKPRHAQEIASFINRLRPGDRPNSLEDIIGLFGEQAFLMLQVGATPSPVLVGLMGYQVENLVARTLDFVLAPQIPPAEAVPLLVSEMERAVLELQCEASLIFAPPEIAGLDEVWLSLGYEPRASNALGVQAWQEAAQEFARPGRLLLFKQLRMDRVLRPI